MAHWTRFRPAERIASLGALLVLGSLLFPWYGIELELFAGFSQTGLESFGFAHAALALTAVAALGLVWRCAAGYMLPRPLDEGALLVLAGIWAALLVAYLAVDRPDEIAGYDAVRLRYGLLVAASGSIAIVLGGLRLRARHRERRGRMV